jgi:alkanesulfonate monooxygenase SsuD/methylene tetrahydromethanopterin reductase-like flavin-dependent oxidoreductase (luciferase family)
VTTFEIGVCLPIVQYGPERSTPRWPEIRQAALNAEQMGLDTLWVPDELLWRSDTPSPLGFWDGVSMAAAAAAVTSRIKIGSWVFSALSRNPGIIAKTAETLDEISGGRFVLGLGAGHAGAQSRAFGIADDLVAARFEDALQVIVPLVREGQANFEGTYHAARNLVQQPVGPRPGRIPLLIGGQKARGIRNAALHADTWSTFAEEHTTLDELGPRLALFEAICQEIGRDPASLGRAAGLEVRPLEAADDTNAAISGSAEQMADQLRVFREGGFSQVDLMVIPSTVEAIDALAPVVELLRAD